MKLWQIICKVTAAAIAVCAAVFLVLKYWSELSLYFGQLWDKIVLRCSRRHGSGTYEEAFDGVDE